MSAPSGEPSIYDAVGGAPAITRIAEAHHARCLADPLLNHPFSHADNNPEHIPRLADYWGEVLGGPPAYTARGADQGFVLRLHGASGAPHDMGERFYDCFVAALDDAAIPADPRLREALRGYMRWAVDDVMTYADQMPEPGPRPVPRWTWSGLQPG